MSDQIEKILFQDGFDPLLANAELNRGLPSKSALVVDQKCMCIVMCEEPGILFLVSYFLILMPKHRGFSSYVQS